MNSTPPADHVDAAGHGRRRTPTRTAGHPTSCAGQSVAPRERQHDHGRLGLASSANLDMDLARHPALLADLECATRRGGKPGPGSPHPVRSPPTTAGRPPCPTPAPAGPGGSARRPAGRRLDRCGWRTRRPIGTEAPSSSSGGPGAGRRQRAAADPSPCPLLAWRRAHRGVAPRPAQPLRGPRGLGGKGIAMRAPGTPAAVQGAGRGLRGARGGRLVFDPTAGRPGPRWDLLSRCDPVANRVADPSCRHDRSPVPRPRRSGRDPAGAAGRFPIASGEIPREVASSRVVRRPASRLTSATGVEIAAGWEAGARWVGTVSWRGAARPPGGWPGRTPTPRCRWPTGRRPWPGRIWSCWPPRRISSAGSRTACGRCSERSGSMPRPATAAGRPVRVLAGLPPAQPGRARPGQRLAGQGRPAAGARAGVRRARPPADPGGAAAAGGR